MLEYFKSLFFSLWQENKELSIERWISRHLSKVLLFELIGIESLEPEIKTRAERLLAKAKEQGLNIRITETFRSVKKQDEYYNKGRTSSGSKVTNAKGLQSYHQYGLAFDVSFVGSNAYPNDNAIWEKLGKIGESLGLVWGGRFNDKPHFEYHLEGKTWEQLNKYYL